MAGITEMVVLFDLKGRVLAAELAGDVEAPKTDEEFSAYLLPLEGQRAVRVQVPREVLELPGPCLDRFFAETQIRWPADVQLPKVEIVYEHKE
jgi:hypothetical protein